MYEILSVKFITAKKDIGNSTVDTQHDTADNQHTHMACAQGIADSHHTFQTTHHECCNKDETNIRKRLTVIAGPSAVGKGTIVKRLQDLYPHIFVSVSVTTRPPRDNEEYGKHYYFISTACFEDMRKNNDLLEWAEVHGKHYYATPRQPVIAALESNRPAILEIDVAGAFQVKEAMPEVFMIFIEPPSWEELERRLIGRASETAHQRERRLQTAREEMAQRKYFDVCVVNDDLDKAVHEVAVLMGLA